MLNWIREAAAALTGPVTEYIRGRNQRSQTRAEAQADVARTEAATAQADVAAENVIEHVQTEAERDWDREAAARGSTSFKDEAWTLIAILPMFIAFIPGGAGVVASGFAAISGAPFWYQAIVGASVSYAFGIRHVFNAITSRWGRR